MNKAKVIICLKYFYILININFLSFIKKDLSNAYNPEDIDFHNLNESLINNA